MLQCLLSTSLHVIYTVALVACTYLATVYPGLAWLWRQSEVVRREEIQRITSDATAPTQQYTIIQFFTGCIVNECHKVSAPGELRHHHDGRVWGLYWND